MFPSSDRLSFFKETGNTILEAAPSGLYSQNKHESSLFAAMPRSSSVSPSFLSDTWWNLDGRVERDTHHSFFRDLKVRHKTELSVMFRQFPPGVPFIVLWHCCATRAGADPGTWKQIGNVSWEETKRRKTVENVAINDVSVVFLFCLKLMSNEIFCTALLSLLSQRQSKTVSFLPLLWHYSFCTYFHRQQLDISTFHITNLIVLFCELLTLFSLQTKKSSHNRAGQTIHMPAILSAIIKKTRRKY